MCAAPTRTHNPSPNLYSLTGRFAIRTWCNLLEPAPSRLTSLYRQPVQCHAMPCHVMLPFLSLHAWPVATTLALTNLSLPTAPFPTPLVEFMVGGSVYDYIHKQRGSMRLGMVVRVGMDVAKGMDFLHKNNIIHRDLKAANLLMDENEVVKVADFGVARVKAGSGIMTAETGTYRWMAPEVIEHRAYDHKADVFSFAITLWELLTGKLPYADLTPLQAAVSVVQKGLRPPIPKGTHPRLAELMARCWHTNPAERPEFSAVLRLLADMAHEVEEEGEGEQRRRERRGGFFASLKRTGGKGFEQRGVWAWLDVPARTPVCMLCRALAALSVVALALQISTTKGSAEAEAEAEAEGRGQGPGARGQGAGGMGQGAGGRGQGAGGRGQGAGGRGQGAGGRGQGAGGRGSPVILQWHWTATETHCFESTPAQGD
ncbi:unnamed protein product [Closterium sp. NIES-53]